MTWAWRRVAQVAPKESSLNHIGDNIVFFTCWEEEEGQEEEGQEEEGQEEDDCEYPPTPAEGRISV